jgi:putative heme-binding domain-containing protein
VDVLSLFRVLPGGSVEIQINIKLLFRFFICCVLSFVLRAQTPEWVWHDNKGKAPADNEVTYFRKTFSVHGKVQRADLAAAGDDQATVYVNGKQVLKSPSWNKASRANVARNLREGDNLIAAMGKNTTSDAAFILKLEIMYADGKKETIVSDTSWLASQKEQTGWETASFQASDWTKPVSRGKLGIQPWGDVMAAPRATAAETLTVLPGFKVELIRSSENEGSWVSMAVDPKGRLIISPQEGRGNMLRVTLDDSGHVAKMETIELPIGGAMGLLYAFESLYVSGAGPEGLGLYRLRDTDGDDKYDKWEMLKKFDGAAGEHGSHALVLGPDKMIYYINGNFTKVPTDISPNSPHRNYAEDTLLPRGEDGNGFGIGIKPPGGFLLRCDPEGKHWELFAAGMRNTYDFDFNADGEAFGFDSDMEWDWGMPWYRPTRIYHLVSGGDYGFREGTAKYPRYYPDILPPTYDIGVGSPTGVKFGTNAKFPAEYQKAMFAMDWSYGRIFAVHLQPNGSSYDATVETFVHGKPLSVTDMEFGKDGALYFMTGGRGTQSGLYRVSYTGNASTARVMPDAGKSKEAEARALRHKLETFHGKKDPTAVDFVWPQLSNPDRFIRNAARLAIESQDVELWQQRALEERNIDGSIAALTALVRNAKSNLQKDIIQALGQLDRKAMNEEQKGAALRVLELVFIRMGRPETDVAQDLIEHLDPVFPSKSEIVNRELVMILVYLQDPNIAEKALALAESAPTLEQQIYYIFHLRTLKAGWNLDLRKRYFTWFNENHDKLTHPPELLRWFTEADREYGHGASYPKFIAHFKSDAVASLNDQERAELAPLIEGKATVVKAPEAPREFVKEWKMDDLIGSLDEVGHGRSFAKGQAAYNAAQCAACHRFGNEGGSVGPDLTTISSRFTRKDILESVIDPSKVVSEQYQNSTLDLKDGEEVTGRVVEDKGDRYIVVTNPLLNTRTEVKKSNIAKKEASKFSPMPAGLVNVLKKDEILDLLAYMESSGKPASAQFQK